MTWTGDKYSWSLVSIKASRSLKPNSESFLTSLNEKYSVWVLNIFTILCNHWCCLTSFDINCDTYCIWKLISNTRVNSDQTVAAEEAFSPNYTYGHQLYLCSVSIWNLQIPQLVLSLRSIWYSCKLFTIPTSTVGLIKTN